MPAVSKKVFIAETKEIPVLVFKMVRVALVGATSTAPPVALVSSKFKYSVPSAVVVLRTWTAKVLGVVSPSPNTTTPLVGMYLTPAAAEPSNVLKLAETAPKEPKLRRTVM